MVYGSLATLGVPELLQIAALFRKMGSLRLRFDQGRVITVYFQDGNLSGLTDTDRAWQLGEVLERLGRFSEREKHRLLKQAKVRGQRLGQLLLDEDLVTKEEMEAVLRKLIMQSLLYAIEDQNSGEFELRLGRVSKTSLTFPMADFLIEITSAVDEFERLKEILGPGGGALEIDPQLDLTPGDSRLSYRMVQVLAHVDGEKSPMEVAAAAPFSPTETLRMLAELAKAGIIARSLSDAEPSVGHAEPLELAPVHAGLRDMGQERRQRAVPGSVW